LSARQPVTSYIGLGANLGLAAQTLRWAVAQMAQWPGVQISAVSDLYRTAPYEAQGPDFINAVVAVDTTLPAPALLRSLLALELQAGRERPYRNAPRTLDLDLLLYGHGSIASPDLTVPHPRMHERAFVLVPLAQIAPEQVSGAQLQAVKNQRIEKLEPWVTNG
jgi:2-amino-4-hydroxy-6-hydroxymethyldihydropteridine diphosphokinase